MVGIPQVQYQFVKRGGTVTKNQRIKMLASPVKLRTFESATMA